MEQKLAYTIDDAVERSSIRRTSLYALIKKGDLKIVKIGRRTLIPDSELVALIQRTTKAAA